MPREKRDKEIRTIELRLTTKELKEMLRLYMDEDAECFIITDGKAELFLPLLDVNINE